MFSHVDIDSVEVFGIAIHWIHQMEKCNPSGVGIGERKYNFVGQQFEREDILCR